MRSSSSGQQPAELFDLSSLQKALPDLIADSIARCRDLVRTPIPEDPAHAQRLTHATYTAVRQLRELASLVQSVVASSYVKSDMDQQKLDQLIALAQEAVCTIHTVSADSAFPDADDTAANAPARQNQDNSDSDSHTPTGCHEF